MNTLKYTRGPGKAPDAYGPVVAIKISDTARSLEFVYLKNGVQVTRGINPREVTEDGGVILFESGPVWSCSKCQDKPCFTNGKYSPTHCHHGARNDGRWGEVFDRELKSSSFREPRKNYQGCLKCLKPHERCECDD